MKTFYIIILTTLIVIIGVVCTICFVISVNNDKHYFLTLFYCIISVGIILLPAMAWWADHMRKVFDIK
jgi:hypothetical protein